MHLSSPTVWPLMASLAGLVANAAAAGAGVVEVDLMFPRNDTYAPGANDTLPVIFAVQNAALAAHLNLEVVFGVYDRSDEFLNHPLALSTVYLRNANLSTLPANETYFFETQFSQKNDLKATEGRWRLGWLASWQSCVEDSFTGGRPADHEFLVDATFWRSVDFIVQPGAQPMDPVAATADGRPCPAELGVAINVTSRTVAVPPAFQPKWHGGGTCAVVDSSGPKPTADPCRVRVDSAVVASLAASRAAEGCSAKSDSCRQNGASRPLAVAPLAVAGAAGLAGMVGALGFFLGGM